MNQNVVIALLLGGLLGTACKKEPAATSSAAATQTGSSEAPTPTTKAVEPASSKPDVRTFDTAHVGPIASVGKLDAAAIKQLFPDATVESKTEVSEGESLESFEVKRGGKAVVTVSPDIGQVVVLDGALKDPRGVGVGSTYEQLVAAYPDLTCERFQSEGGEEDLGPADMVTCKTPAMKGVDYQLDVMAAKKPATLPAAAAAAGSKLSQIIVQLTLSPAP